MKKTILLAVATLFFALSAQAQKIGHFTQSEVIRLMPEFIEAEKKLVEHRDALAKSIQDMNTDLTAKITKYQNEAPKMTQAMKEVTEKELREGEMRLQEKLQRSEEELANKEAELLKPVIEKLRTAVISVAAKNNFDYILEKSELHFAKDAHDVTNMIKAELGIK